MPTSKIQVKLYLEASGDVPLDRYIPVFHDFIREDRIPELMIDVVDYGHVHHGPGVVLIGHATDYGLELSEGRPGLLGFRKRDPVPEGERFADALGRVLRVASLLQKEAVLHARFSTAELLFRLPDRLRAPNTDATFQSVAPELSRLAERLYDAAVTLEREGTPREMFTVRLSSPTAPTVDAMLAKLQAT